LNKLPSIVDAGRSTPTLDTATRKIRRRMHVLRPGKTRVLLLEARRKTMTVSG